MDLSAKNKPNVYKRARFTDDVHFEDSRPAIVSEFLVFQAIVINGNPALSTLTVAENTKGTDLATLSTTDQDVGQTHTYTMQGDNEDFTLTANGKLMVGSSPCWTINSTVG